MMGLEIEHRERIRVRDAVQSKSKCTLKKLDHFPLGIQEFEPVAQLARGAFGMVNLMWHGQTERALVIKRLNKNHLLFKKQHMAVIHEKRVQHQCSHPLIANLNGTFQDDECLYSA